MPTTNSTTPKAPRTNGFPHQIQPAGKAVPPPVYRPTAAPRKLVPQQGALYGAPPVYRPNQDARAGANRVVNGPSAKPLPKPHQLAGLPHQAQPAGKAPRQTAPPVYRPNQDRLTQPKSNGAARTFRPGAPGQQSPGTSQPTQIQRTWTNPLSSATARFSGSIQRALSGSQELVYDV